LPDGDGGPEAIPGGWVNDCGRSRTAADRGRRFGDLAEEAKRGSVRAWCAWSGGGSCGRH
jgi:hypothetical protein